MNNYLRIGSLALVLILLITLAGCGAVSSKNETPKVPSEEASSPAPTPPVAPVSLEEPTPADETIHVSTAGEFLEAIAPGAVIELAPGVYNLTEYLHEASDTISDYISRSFTDGWQADVHDISGLKICGAKDGNVEIVAEPRYSDVLCFQDCSDIEIENITFGHTIEQGNCQGAVLEFDKCRDIRLDGLDLYGCGTYGVAADNTVGLTLKDSIIRDCSYGIIDLSFCSDAVLEGCSIKNNSGFDMLSLSDSSVLFRGCAFSGNEGYSFLPSYFSSENKSSARFEDCTFGAWESQRLKEELNSSESYVFDEGCRFEGYSWSDIMEHSDDPEDPEKVFDWIALDTTRLKVASFDTKVLTSDEYYILYEIVNKNSGDISFETSDDVRFLTFEDSGKGCFWTDNEKGRPFNYAMDSAYSCQISFDDGGEASFGLYVDQGGALPRISEADHIWLALYLDDEVLWFY